MQYLISVFISAFLIFQIQPIISKIILPSFGGGASVWTTCMLFFQLFLLIGYLYAYVLSKILKEKQQIGLHLACLILALFLLPSNINEVQAISVTGSPTLAVLKVLLFSLGFPYLILSANTPLLQHWFTHDNKGENPYRLYAISNIGAFIALISYPFLIEPFVALNWQINLWSCIYALFVLMVGYIFYRVVIQSRHIKASAPQQLIDSRVGAGRLFLWFMMSALGVVLLVSATNALTQNIPPVPFLWIAPLAIYLLTYVLAFSQLRIYQRKLWLPFFMVLSFAALLIYFIGGQFDIISQLVIYLLILLCGCMICHGELYFLKPQQGNTTLFYLVLSAGGVFGSFLVAFVAKSLFNEFLEFPLAVLGVLVLAAISVWFDKANSLSTTKSNTALNRQLSYLSAASLVVGMIWLFAFTNLKNLYQQYDIANARNFYGILSVKDIIQGEVNERRLVDGTTSHGSQSLPLSKSAVPLSYFRPGTGVQLVIEELSRDKNLQVGIIGLGVGALAAYGQAGDKYTFYELNPLVSDYAKKYFSYLENSQADIDIKLGDARVSLQSEINLGHTNAFDLLIIDAFSGDLIPTHLLTHEAFLIYQQHINKQGVMVFHISNRHLSLLPVIMQHSISFDLQIMLFDTPGGENEHDAQWVVLTSNKKLTQSPKLQGEQTRLDKEHYQQVLWTDDYSSLLPILKVLN